MTFDLVKTLSRTASNEAHSDHLVHVRTISSSSSIRSHHSTNPHAAHHKHAPLPFLASPVNAQALEWVRKRKRHPASGGLHGARTVAQFESEHSDSGLAHRIFRKQHEASTLELFFDLFFVANLAVFTTKSSHVDRASLLNYIGFFSIIWSIWFHIAMFDVRFYVDSIFTRTMKFLAFGIMVSFVGFTSLYDAILSGGQSRAFQGLALVMFACRLLFVLQYGVVLYFVREFEETLIPMLLTMFTYLIAAFCFFGTWLDDRGAASLSGEQGRAHVETWYSIIAVEAVVVIFVSCVWRIVSFKHTHLVERFGLLTLIVMGEGIIGLVKSTSYSIQGTEVHLWSETGIVACAVLLIYLIYVLYFDNIDHHRFGSIGQQVWALLHWPLHVSILLTVEGSTALIIWNACRAAISWVTTDALPSLSDPTTRTGGLVPFQNNTQFLEAVNNTFFTTQRRYYYKDLIEYYPKFTDDLLELNGTSAKHPFGTTAWKNAVTPILSRMSEYFQYFIYKNFNAEGPTANIEATSVYTEKVQLFEDGFKFTVCYFYIAAGALLFVLAFLYWFGHRHKTGTEWFSIGVRIMGGMCLPLMVISPLREDRLPDPDSSFRFRFSALLIPIVALGYLVIIIVDNVVKGFSERHWQVVMEERWVSRAGTMLGGGGGVGTGSGSGEEEETSYEMHRPAIHGVPELVHHAAPAEGDGTDDDEGDKAGLVKNAQRTPMIKFGGAGARRNGYAEIEQEGDGDDLRHFRTKSLRGQH